MDKGKNQITHSAKPEVSQHSRRPRNELVKGLAAFSLLATTIILLYKDNVLLFALLLAESLLVLGFWHDTYDIYFFSIAAVLGTLAEILFVHFGVWQYTNPTGLGIPLWFPLAFGMSGVIGERLVYTIFVMRSSSRVFKT